MVWIIISCVEYILLGRILYKLGIKDKELPCSKFVWAIISCLLVIMIPIALILKIVDTLGKKLLKTLKEGV